MFVAVAAIRQVPLAVPPALVMPAYVVLGAGMGSAVRPDLLLDFGHPAVSATAILLAILATTAAGYVVLRLCGWGAETAFFSAVPGALVQSVALAEAVPGVNVPVVAMVQTLRLIVLVTVVPLIIGSVGAPVPVPVAEVPFDLPLFLLLATCAIGQFLAHRLRLPAALLIGPFFASLLLHGSGLNAAHVPQPLLIPAYVVIGAHIGTRFGRTSPDVLLRLILPALASTGSGIVVALGVAWGAAAVLSVPPMLAFLAFAPGGIDAMSILALALHLDAGFVVLLQVARFLLLTVLLPFCAPRMQGGAEE
ncbi:ammonia monooxygenase [Celeribacter indicus]|uniref:Ammonia monooxygenase n=1 Tax=Celeribacter indicus TaxID=1208324 RepID=A0A0B5DRU3_9RHOB|nr:ammonia monooxygenase [Celeribacter indicus]